MRDPEEQKYDLATLSELIFACRREFCSLEKRVMPYIENGVVEFIFRDGTHCANGLLLTENGFILTNDHVVCDKWGLLKVRLFNGRCFDLDRICRTDPYHDLALVKAHLPFTNYPCCYKFYSHLFRLTDSPAVTLLTRRSAQLLRQQGAMHKILIDPVYLPHDQVFDPDRYRTVKCQPRYYRHIRITVPVRIGDSGGLIVTRDGCLVGLLSLSGYASCATMKDGFRLILDYYRQLCEQICLESTREILY